MTKVFFKRQLENLQIREFWYKILNFVFLLQILHELNFTNVTVIWVSFLGVRFEFGGGAVKLQPAPSSPPV